MQITIQNNIKYKIHKKIKKGKQMKYQYSYFIHPYIVDERKYSQHLLRLLKNKNCSLKILEKEKELNLYTYFLPKRKSRKAK